MASEFPVDWRVMALQDCLEAIIDYRGKSPVKTAIGVPLITAKIVKGGRILRPDEYIDYGAFESWMRRGLPEPGDVVMTTEAPLGEVAQLGLEQVALAQRLITLRGSPRLLDNTYLKFAMQSDFVQAQLRARATGTTVLGIRQSELRKVVLPIPPLAEQHAIAHVLGSLDDKIELNRRMNETLEAMARAIFKSWFVDFDPVRAKVEGRQPVGMDAETAALFPDGFEGSELGEIPKEWKTESLGDVLELAYGRALKESDRRPGSIPVYGSSGRIGWHDESLANGPGIVVGRKGNPGIVTWAPGDFYAIDTAFYVVPKGPCRSLPYLYHALQYQNLPSLSADSAVPGLNRGIAYLNRMVVPPAEVVAVFESLVEPLGRLQHANEEQSRTLAEMRDTLLPKLLSGEIRVKDGCD